MASYSEIQYVVAQYMARDDLTEQIIWAIGRFQDFINRKLRTQPQTVFGNVDPVDGSAPLPAGFLSMRSVIWQGTPPHSLQYVSPDFLYSGISRLDVPSKYTIDVSSILIDSADTTTLTLSYYQTNIYLSDAMPTNWLSNNHADLYIFGTLVELNAYVQDVEAATLWKQRRDEIVQELIDANFRLPGPMQIQPTGATP